MSNEAFFTGLRGQEAQDEAWIPLPPTAPLVDVFVGVWCRVLGGGDACEHAINWW